MLLISLSGILAVRGQERLVFRESLRVKLIESCLIEDTAQPSEVTLFYWQGWSLVAAAQAAIFPSYDGNGNVVGLMQSGGVSVAYYEYDSFGRCIRATGSAAVWNRFRFATKSSDAETGLIYHQARYYSSELGRFISADPAGAPSLGIRLWKTGFGS